MVNRTILGLLATVLLVAGCEDSAFVDPSETRSGVIVEGDTTILRGESMSLSYLAEYRFGPGVPVEVVWGQSDTAVLGLVGLPLGQVQVTGKRSGSSLVVARINRDFLDTITVTVVDTGAVRWRRTVAGGGGLHGWDLAVGDSGQVATTDGAGQMIVFRANGDTLWRAAGACNNLTGPALTGLGIWSTGTNCVAYFSIEGTQVWSHAFGGPDERMAVAPNGDVIVLALVDTADTTLAVTRYNVIGTMLWRDTLQTGLGTVNPRGGIALATNGDIYIAWRGAFGYVSRLTSSGQLKWTDTLPGEPRETAPAVLGARVYVVHGLGVSVRDSSGAVVYDRPFSEVDGSFATVTSSPPPVIDALGNLFVQHPQGLFSLDPAGVVRWVADSLGRGGSYNSGPGILEGGSQLVVLCGLRACGINGATGAVVWRGPPLATSPQFYGGLAVAPNGTLYVMFDNEVLALWHRRPTSPTGWPTLGGNRGRSGTAP